MVLAALVAGGVGHEHDDELLLRIGPPQRAVGAVPEELARAADEPGAATRRRAHRDRDAEAVAGGVRIRHRDVVLDLRRHLVGRHRLDRLAAEDARAVESAESSNIWPKRR